MENKRLDKLFQTELNRVDKSSDIDKHWLNMNNRLKSSENNNKIWITGLFALGILIASTLLVFSSTFSKTENKIQISHIDSKVNKLKLEESNSHNRNKGLTSTSSITKEDNKPIPQNHKVKHNNVKISGLTIPSDEKKETLPLAKEKVYESQYYSNDIIRTEKTKDANTNKENTISTNPTKDYAPRANQILKNIPIQVETNSTLLQTLIPIRTNQKSNVEFKKNNLPSSKMKMTSAKQTSRKKKFLLHASLTKDFLSPRFTDSTRASITLKTVWWPTNKIGISFGYNRQNIRRSFGKNFNGIPQPDLYGAYESIESGSVRYQQNFYRPGIMVQIFKIKQAEIFATGGVQLSSSKQGGLSLLASNSYETNYVEFILEENKLSLSSYSMGCSMQYPIHPFMGLEINYGYQIQTKQQSIIWDSAHNFSAGLFYNF